MSYTYLSTESGVDNTNKQPHETSSEISPEAVSLNATESSSPAHQSHRPTAWIAVAVSAVTFLVGLSLFAFLSTRTDLPDQAVPDEPAQQLQQKSS